MSKLRQVILAFLPLMITPALGYGLAEGILNLGGGEKDMLWAFVWAFWATLFAVTSCFLIYRNWSPRRWLARSALISAGVMVVLWLLAFATSMLGIA